MDNDVRRGTTATLAHQQTMIERQHMLPSVHTGRADTPRYLVTMYVGIGDAVVVGLGAVDQLIQNDPAAYGKIDVLCNNVQAELFAHDPRVNRVIEASRILFPPPEVTSWLKGIFPNAEAAQLMQFLHDRHYQAVVSGMFAPGLYARLQTHVIEPMLWQLGGDFLALRKLQDRPMSKIIRRAVNRSFGLSTPFSELSETIPLYLSSAHLQKAANVVAQMKAQAAIEGDERKLLVVAPDTASDVTRPPTALLASALHSVLEQEQHLCICILPSYTYPTASEELWQKLTSDFAGRVFLAASTPRATLLETTALLDQADVFVTGDTGVMHLAATTKRLSSDDDTRYRPRNDTRIIALFGGTNPALYGYSQRTTIIGRGRREQRAYCPGIAKEAYKLKGKNLFDHITPQEVAQTILAGLIERCYVVLPVAPTRDTTTFPKAQGVQRNDM